MDLLLSEFSRLNGLQGHIGTIAFLVYLAVRVYRLPNIQAALPTQAQWGNLVPLVKYAVIGALAGIGGALASLATDVSWTDALHAAGASIIAAIAGEQMTNLPIVKGMVGLLLPADNPPVVSQSTVSSKAPIPSLGNVLSVNPAVPVPPDPVPPAPVATVAVPLASVAPEPPKPQS